MPDPRGPVTLVALGLLVTACAGGASPRQDAGRDAQAQERPEPGDASDGPLDQVGDVPGLGTDGNGYTDADAEKGDGTVRIVPQRGRIAVGNGFACALDTAGKPICWGETLTSSPPSGDGFTFIAAGVDGACAIDRNGGVICWTDSITIPSNVDKNIPPAPFQEVTVGGDQHSEFACAVRRTGETYCWRNADSPPFPELTTVPSGLRMAQISAGLSHVCGLKTDGTPACWGVSTTPALNAVPNAPFVDIASGAQFTCALTATGHPKCWGQNYFDTDFPTTLDAAAIAASRSTVNDIVCALLRDGNVRCTVTGASYPGPADKKLRFEELAVGPRHVCGVVAGELRVVCWSSATPIPGDVTAVPSSLRVVAR